MNKIIKVSYIFTIISYIIIHIPGLPYTRMIRDAMLLINLFMHLIYFIGIKKELYVTKYIKLVIIGLLILFYLYPMININNIYSNEIKLYALESLLFILNVVFISMYLYLNNLKYEYINITYITLAIILIIQYILNFDNLEVLKYIHMVFANAERYRWSFGFNHPNTVAQLCFILLVLYKYIKENKKLNKKYKYKFINFIAVIMLLSTSSRTGITAITIFYIIYNIKYFIDKNNFTKRAYIKISIKIMAIVILISSVYYIYLNIAEDEILHLFAQSNRLLNFTINIPILYKYNKELFGIGYLSPGMVLSEDFYYKMINIDNWFLYIFISLGLCGLILSILLIIYIYIGINNSNNDRNLNLALLISFLYYSMFESIFFLNDLAASFIIWILLMLALYGKRTYKQF